MFKTLLGWRIIGANSETTFDTTVACNRISVQDKVSKNVASHYFVRETEVRGIRIEQMLKNIYTAEFNDNGTSRAAENITKMSIKDRQFLDLMERECSKEGNITSGLYHPEIQMQYEAMFYQVFMTNQHRSLLSFLW